MSLTVSVTPSLEGFLREKLALGEYDSASEVVCEALRLLQRREELWSVGARAKIEKGMASLRAGRTIPATEVWAKLERTIAIAEKRRSGRSQ
jgi:antitoxin ParD1/3/4